MASLKKDSAKVSPKPTLTDKKVSGMSSGPKDKGKSVKTPGSAYSVCASDISKDNPPHFRDHVKTPGSAYSVCKSDISKDNPPHFRDRVKTPGSAYSVCKSDISKDNPPHFRDHVKTPGSAYSVCKSDISKDNPPHFRDRVKKPASVCASDISKDNPPHFRDHMKMPGSTYSAYKTEKPSRDVALHFREEPQMGTTYAAFVAERSDIPLHFKKHHVKTSGFTNSMAEKSSKDIPLHFREQGATPDDGYSAYQTDLCSEDIPPHFDNNVKLPYGLPQAWGGHVYCPRDPSPMVNFAKPILGPKKTNQQEDFPSHAKRSGDYRERAEWSVMSDTSDYSSNSGSRDSQCEERTVSSDDIYENSQKVICDMCGQAKAVKICLTCNSSYCEYHARPHYKVKALQRHLLRDVCDEVARKRCLHYTKSLDFFCRTDQMLICSVCKHENHSGHDIICQRKAESHVSGNDENQNTRPAEKVVPPPGDIEFLSVRTDSVVLGWGCPEGLEDPKRFRLLWSSSTEVEGSLVIKDSQKVEINKLQLGQKYFFSVATEDKEGDLSEWVTASVFTAVPEPHNVTKGHSEATSLSLKWTKGDRMEGIPHQYLIRIKRRGKTVLAIHTEDCYKMVSDLEPDTEYTVSVSTVLNNEYSKPVSINMHTEPCLREVLSKIRLDDQYDNKFTLRTVLEINQNDASENKHETAKSPPEAFLRKLMMLNADARSIRRVPNDVASDERDAANPLDLITALFLCSDGFLQQNIALKMSLCQFAIPLLLPNYETKEITLMLWSMREIVRTFRPSKQAFRKLGCEERIVLSEIPLLSFVRLGKTNLSKSLMLNKLLSNKQPCHDTFYHRNMVCGDVPRRISHGLVEISWYLPCGSRSEDKFTEPLAVSNLRGDIREFDKQFSFLCQTSATVYIFCDKSETDYFKNLEGKDVKANIILISREQGDAFTLKRMTTKPSLKTTNESQKKRTDTELTKALQESVSKMLEKWPNKVSVANLAKRARCCGILVDEDTDECQRAWKNASKIIKQVDNASTFKDKQLIYQGHIWKAISGLETECWRLRKAGNQNTEDYQNSLKTKEKELRKKQNRFEMTAPMTSFLCGVVTSEVHRYYFLKWLEIDLDNLSRNQMSALQEQYKELRQKIPQDTEKIAEIDKQISACSLRLEHFFRECGQLFECAISLPEFSRQRKNIEQLPALCAQMLLDGIPLELVDGDAANIPMKWISEVLEELHSNMQSSSKLKVISIIGAENSGKSTLLNTMFGSRFSVSRGTCTRGAFLQLITVNNDIREELGCDCIMLIDTEGLKPHQMAQEDHSHERDKEVASLAVALSDVTIVSVTGDKSSEKDILDLVLHALTRLKHVDRKPQGHFVHCDMSATSPVVRRTSTEWVEVFNKIIRKDVKMKKANITKISDVMEFDPDTCSWHIPPIWHGTPPMAPVSVDYSETAQVLKKRLIADLKRCKQRGDLTDFVEKVKAYWEAI